MSFNLFYQVIYVCILSTRIVLGINVKVILLSRRRAINFETSVHSLFFACDNRFHCMLLRGTVVMLRVAVSVCFAVEWWNRDKVGNAVALTPHSTPVSPAGNGLVLPYLPACGGTLEGQSQSRSGDDRSTVGGCCWLLLDMCIILRFYIFVELKLMPREAFTSIYLFSWQENWILLVIAFL